MIQRQISEDWQALTTLTGGDSVFVERVRLKRRDIAIEGRFELPPLARLPAEDQVFVAAFVRAHGSIKEMEALFGVSYPTVKNRLNRLAAQLDFVDVSAPVEPAPPAVSATNRGAVLDRLERGEISVDEAVKALAPAGAAAPAAEPEEARS
jgi:hypothetical protein